jgi:hypothetical protein
MISCWRRRAYSAMSSGLLRRVGQRAGTQAAGSQFRDRAQAPTNTLCRGTGDYTTATEQVERSQGIFPHSSGRHRCRTLRSHVYGRATRSQPQ